MTPLSALGVAAVGPRADAVGSSQGPAGEQAAAGLQVADAVMQQLARLMRLIERVRLPGSEGGDRPLERSDYLLLVHLVGGGPKRSGALAAAVHSDPSTVSRQVAQLVRLGLVERRPDPQDGRASLLAATEAGRALYGRTRRCKDEYMARILAPWPERDRTALVALLDRLVTDLERHDPRWVQGCAEPSAASERGY